MQENQQRQITEDISDEDREVCRRLALNQDWSLPDLSHFEAADNTEYFIK